MAVQFMFSQFDGRKCFFSQIQQAPDPDFRKVGKSLCPGKGLKIQTQNHLGLWVKIYFNHLLHIYNEMLKRVDFLCTKLMHICLKMYKMPKLIYFELTTLYLHRFIKLS